MALYAPIHSGSRAASKFYVIRTDDPNQEAKEQLRLLVDSTATAMVPKLATKSASDLLLKLGREDAEIVAPLLISAANRYSYEHFFSHQPTRDDRYYDGLVEMALHGEVGRLAKLGWGPGWSGNIDPKTGKAANPERHPYQHYASSKTVDTLIEAGRMKRAAHGSGPRSKVRKWRCVECGYEAKDSGQVGRHILTAHKGANPSRTRAALSSRTAASNPDPRCGALVGRATFKKCDKPSHFVTKMAGEGTEYRCLSHVIINQPGSKPWTKPLHGADCRVCLKAKVRHSISNPASKVQLAYLTGRTGLYQDGKDKGKPADPLYPDYLNTHQEKMAYWKGVGDADNAYAAEQATRNEGADRARHHREFQASTHEGFIDNPRGRGNPFRTRATESGREAGGSPSSITTAGGRIPSQVAVLGVLTSVTIVDPNGKKDTVRPQLGGADVLLCTSASGKELYCLPKPANFQPIQQSLIGSAAGRKATEFHGAQVSKQATVSVSDTAIPRKQKLLGMVEGLVYEPMPGSPKANTQWTHEIGDTGGKKVGTKIALTSRMDGKGLYLTILKRSGPYPVTNDRGIVG